MKKRLSIPLLLCAAGLVYALVATPPQIIPEPVATAPEDTVPENYAAQVSVREFDESGRLSDRTDAEELRRFRKRVITELDEPRRWGYGEDGPWQASARHGELEEQREVLTLDGDVNLHYPSDDVRFATESLVINLARQTAQSRAPVTATQDRNITRAESAYLHLGNEVATLRGNVRTRYIPDSDDPES